MLGRREPTRVRGAGAISTHTHTHTHTHGAATRPARTHAAPSPMQTPPMLEPSNPCRPTCLPSQSPMPSQHRHPCQVRCGKRTPRARQRKKRTAANPEPSACTCDGRRQRQTLSPLPTPSPPLDRAPPPVFQVLPRSVLRPRPLPQPPQPQATHPCPHNLRCSTSAPPFPPYSPAFLP